MLSLLQDILCACLAIPYYMSDLLVGLANLFFVALGAALVAILVLLPDFPDPPDTPSGGVIGYANWLFPIEGVLLIFTTLAALWVAFLLYRIVLNWIKAL